MINPSKLCLKATQTKIHWLKSKSLLKNPHLYKTQPAAGKNDENDIYLRPLAIIETGAHGQAYMFKWLVSWFSRPTFDLIHELARLRQYIHKKPLMVSYEL